MILTIVILVSVICFLLLTMAIYNLRDKINYLENTVDDLNVTNRGLVLEVTLMSDKIK